MVDMVTEAVAAEDMVTEVDTAVVVMEVIIIRNPRIEF